MSAANVRSIRATVLAALAVCTVPAGTAHARLLFWPQWGYWSGDHAPSRQSHRQRHAEPKSAKKDQAQDAPNGPLQIIISIADQRISVYDNGALIGRSSVSTGIPRHPTPLGVLHAGVLPGYPASHGCIRLKNDFAIRLWHLTKRGTRVVIASDDIRPVEIAHPRLFASKPKAASGPSESRAAIADNAAMATATVHAPSTDTQQVTDLQALGSMQAAVVPRKVLPISVFVSRKSSKLFVRQGFTPLFDIPVRIQDPEQSLGTHVFTVGLQNEDETLRWTVVSMPEKSLPAPSKRRERGKQIVEITPPASSPDKASAALDRIEIPQDVVERISELLTPGSALIVSDYGISEETGKDTDFIVVTQ